MNARNTLPESYYQRVYKNILAPVKRQMQQAEIPTLAVFIHTEATSVNHSIRVVYWTTELALEEPQFGSSHPNILIDNH